MFVDFFGKLVVYFHYLIYSHTPFVSGGATTVAPFTLVKGDGIHLFFACGRFHIFFEQVHYFAGIKDSGELGNRGFVELVLLFTILANFSYQTLRHDDICRVGHEKWRHTHIDETR